MAQTYLLDTHVPVEASNEDGLAAMPVGVRRILCDPEAELLLSVVSEVEIAIKSALGKLDLSGSATPIDYSPCRYIIRIRSTA